MDTAPACGHITRPAAPTSHPAPIPANQFTLRNYRQRLEYPVNVCIAEPFFMELDAKIDWSPVMNTEEMREGVSRISRR
jgi:hypothetical protein